MTEPVPTVRDRMLAARIRPEAIDQHHAAGLIRYDGQPITSLDQPAPKPGRVVIAGT